MPGSSFLRELGHVESTYDNDRIGHDKELGALVLGSQRGTEDHDWNADDNHSDV